MEKLKDMSVMDVLEQTELCMGENDLPFYCNNKEAIEEFKRLKKEDKLNNMEVRKFFRKYEKTIDKERLILVMVIHYREHIYQLEEELKERKSTLVGNRDIHILEIEKQIERQKRNLKRTINLAKEINKCFIMPYYNEKTNRCEVQIFDPREIIYGTSKKENNKIEELKQICSNLNMEGENKVIEYIISQLEISDLYDIFTDRQLGESVINGEMLNILAKEGRVNREDLKSLKGNYVKERQILKDKNFAKGFSEIKEAIENYIRYVDLEKFFMIAAYRMEENLEETEITPDELIMMKKVLEELLRYAKENKACLLCEINDKKDEKEQVKKVKYSAKNIQDCLNRFINETYLRKKDLEEYKNKINNSEMTLQDLDKNYIDVIYTAKELKELATLNEKNFNYVLQNCNWKKDEIINIIKDSNQLNMEVLKQLISSKLLSEQEIMQMYMGGNINIEQLKEISNIIDLKKYVDASKLNTFYNSNDESFEKTLELTKLLLSKSGDKGREKYSEDLIQDILENSNKQNNIDLLNFYYQEGLLKLESIADWAGESAITELYNNKIIDLEDVISLAQKDKISTKYAMDKYEKKIFDKQCEYDERLKYIKMGFVTTDSLKKLYKSGDIFKSDLKELINDRILSQDEFDEIINAINLEELEKNSKIKLGDLKNLSKKRNKNLYLDDTDKCQYKAKKNNVIIDPNEREDYLRLFGAYMAEPDDLDETHPFYNYQFYAIPDKNGNLTKDSVIIAERYYEDKDTQMRFACNNATYFFRYEDLLVLSNLSKKEMTQERKDIVFKVNHSLANENRPGSWAINTFCTIAKTMIGSDLEEYSKNNQRLIILEKLNQVYGTKKVLEMLNKSKLIDEGNYLCDIQDYVVYSKELPNGDER